MERPAYFDTCLLFPLFVEEASTPRALHAAAEYTRNGEWPLLISDWTIIEFHSVVARCFRNGDISREQAVAAMKKFDRDCQTAFFILPLRPSLFHLAKTWIVGLEIPLKASDALHLAIAHANKCALVTADRRLAAAATALGVACFFVPFS